MKKHLIILSTLIYFLTALTIPKKPIITTPQKIDWPFNYCKRNENEKKEDWKIEKLFFGSKPKKGYITEFFIVINLIIQVGTATNKTSFSVLLINIKLNGVFIHS